MRPQLNPLILGPGAPWSLPGSSIDIQFTTSRAAVNRQTSSISSLLTTTRASTGYATTSTGSLTLFPANTPRITDLGLLVEQAATNLFLNSVGFGTGWGGNSAGATASIGVGTANFTVAPDGTTTATRVQLALNGATTSSDISEWIVTPSVTISNATAYTQGIWIKSNTGSSINMSITDVNNSGSQIVVTTTWTRFSLTATSSGTSANFQLRLRGGQTPVNPNTADISIWGGQLELGSFATSNITTTTVAVTRAADSVSLAGAALIAGLNIPASIRLKFGPLNLAGAGTTRAIAWSGGGAITAVTNSMSLSPAGPSALFTRPITTGPTTIAGGYDGTNASLVANNETLVAGTLNTSTYTGTVTLGNLADGTRAVNGYLQRATFWNSRLSNTQLQALSQ